MKNIIVIIYIMALIPIIGCEDYLETIPKTQLVPENLYENEKGIELGTKGLYLSLRSATMADTWDHWLITEVAGDDMVCHSDKSERQNLDKYLFSSENVVLLDQWRRYYKIIADCNSLIENVNSSGVDDLSVKNQAIGEASFIRGYAYYMLVRIWGDVPLVVNEVKAGDDFFVQRSDKALVYEQILADFTLAEQVLPVMYESPQDQGRITRGAAKAFLAKVHLTLGDYENAKNKSGEVMLLGYQLLPDYLSVFSPAGNNSGESILDIQALTNVDGMGSIMGRYWSPKKNIYGHKGTDQYTVSYHLYNLFEASDLRKNSFVLVKNPVANNQKLPYTLKYLDPGANSEKLYGTNFHLARYAEVLLIFAEAENEVNGPTDLAYNAINQVRGRANIGDLPLGLTKEEFREHVYSERRKELYFEGERWFDLVRTNRLKESIEMVPSGMTVDYFPVVELPKHLLFPVPSVEIQSNQNLLPNNPGY